MDSQRYFGLMKETGEKTYKKIESILDESIGEDSLRGFIERFMYGRLENKRRLRSLLVRGVYQAVSDENWLECLDVCAAFELWCLADYLSNDIFDGKLDKCRVEIERDPNLFYMASSVIREVSGETLMDAARKLRPEREGKVLELFSELVKDAYMHQWVDYTLKYKGESPEELRGRIDELFHRRYIEYEAGNCLGKICKISAVLFGAGEDYQETLAEYGRKFSAALQVVNDIADIAEGTYDLKNRLLTYPLVLTMTKTGENVYEMPGEEVRKLFVRSGAFDECRGRALRIGKEAKRCIKSFGVEQREILSSMLVFIRSNRYYKMLRE